MLCCIGLMKTPPHMRFIDREWLIVQLQWEPRDLWVGCFWRKTDIAVHVYLCVLPLLPVHITVLRGRLRRDRKRSQMRLIEEE